jgi:peptidoglycan/LPS O-acetylase OafA/YrhL
MVPIIILAANSLGAYPRFAFVLGDAIINTGIALCIQRCIQSAETPLGRLLNSRPLVFTGLMSYSLYLWQQPFLNRNAPAKLTTFPVNLLLAFACASVSYFIVERPMLRRRRDMEQWLFKPREKTGIRGPTPANTPPCASTMT